MNIIEKDDKMIIFIFYKLTYYLNIFIHFKE